MIKRINKLVILTLSLTSIVSLGVSCQGTNNEENEPTKIVKSIKEQRMDLIKKFYSAYLGIDVDSFESYNEENNLATHFKNPFIETNPEEKDKKLWNYIGIERFNPANKFHNDFFVNLQKLIDKSETTYNNFIKDENDVSSIKYIINEWKIFWDKYKYYRLKPNYLFYEDETYRSYYQTRFYPFDKDNWYMNYSETRIGTDIFDAKTIKSKSDLRKIAQILDKQKKYISSTTVNEILKIIWKDKIVIAKPTHSLSNTKFKIDLNDIILLDLSSGKWEGSNLSLDIHLGIINTSGDIVDYNRRFLDIDLSPINYKKNDKASKLIWRNGEKYIEGLNQEFYSYNYYLAAKRLDDLDTFDYNSYSWTVQKDRKKRIHFVMHIDRHINEYIGNMTQTLNINPLSVWESNANLKLNRDITYDSKMLPIFDSYVTQFFGFLGGNIIRDYETMYTQSPKTGYNKTHKLLMSDVWRNVKKSLLKVIGLNFAGSKTHDDTNQNIFKYSINASAKYLLLGIDDTNTNKLGNDNLIEWAIAKYKDNANFEKIKQSFSSIENLSSELLIPKHLQNIYIDWVEKALSESNDEQGAKRALDIIKNEWIKYVFKQENNIKIQKDLNGILTSEQIKEMKKIIVSAILEPYYALFQIFKFTDKTYTWPKAYLKLLEQGYMSKFIENN